MDDREMFEEGLRAVYAGKAVMRITLLEDARVIELAPIMGFEEWDSED